MLVIVEGIDRVGKTTLCDKLVKNGFIKLKDAFTLNENYPMPFNEAVDTKEMFATFSIGKLETAINYIKQLSDMGYNIVADRLHLTELVYGEVERGHTNLSLITALDNMIKQKFGYNAVLVMVEPEDVNRSFEEAGKTMYNHIMLFEYGFRHSFIDQKMVTKYSELDEAVEKIVRRTTEYDIYFASPFFRPDQIEREERLKAHLRNLGFKVFSPKENCNLSPIAEQALQQQVFDDNCNSIKGSAAVFAITDGKDMGTIWEAGFAFALGKPVIYYAETLGENQFNLMLAKSGRAVFKSQDEVTYTAMAKAMFSGEVIEYGGIIE